MPSSVVTSSVWKLFSPPVGEAAATGGPCAATRDEMRSTYCCLASSCEDTEREKRCAHYGYNYGSVNNLLRVMNVLVAHIELDLSCTSSNNWFGSKGLTFGPFVQKTDATSVFAIRQRMIRSKQTASSTVLKRSCFECRVVFTTDYNTITFYQLTCDKTPRDFQASHFALFTKSSIPGFGVLQGPCVA